MSTPLQFPSLYDGQEVFVWSDCLLDLSDMSTNKATPMFKHFPLTRCAVCVCVCDVCVCVLLVHVCVCVCVCVCVLLVHVCVCARVCMGVCFF